MGNTLPIKNWIQIPWAFYLQFFSGSQHFKWLSSVEKTRCQATLFQWKTSIFGSVKLLRLEGSSQANLIAILADNFSPAKLDIMYSYSP